MKGFAYWSDYMNICRTIQEDSPTGYVRYGDSNACGYALAKASRDANAGMEDFLLCTRQFLATSGDRNSEIASMDPAYEEWELGFTARRKGEHLYVTEVTGDIDLKPGDEIFAVGDERIPDLRTKFGQNIFWENQDEREDWDLLFRMYETLEVFPGDGSAKRVKMKRFPKAPSKPENRRNVLSDGTVLLQVETLADAGEVQAFMEESRENLQKANALILDLRKCEAEGDPESFLPILPYLVDRSVSAGELFPTRTIFTSYTKQNAQRRLAQLEVWKDMAEDPEEKLLAEETIGEVKEKAARVQELRRSKTKLNERRVFNEVEEQEETGIEECRIEKAEGPGKVIILADTTCRYAGEWLIDGVRGLQKVTVVGRPTAGMLDYTNFITIDYDDIKARFTYPMSRTAQAKEGKGVQFKGVPVDVYIPFTREECTKDLILEKGLELCKA